jgi:type IV secretion system protein VirD4
LGYPTSSTSSFGFLPSAQRAEQRGEPLTYEGDGHLITVAPTRTGKGRGVLIPNLLTYPGSTVVFDPKGELYRVTARRRVEMGHRVVRLDPCHVIGPDPDTLNPFDIFDLANADLETDAQMIASWLSNGGSLGKEPFWDLQGAALQAAVIAHVASGMPENERNLESVRKYLMSSDTVYNLALLLDNKGKTMNRMSYDEIAAFLQTAELTRSGILSTACSYIKIFLSPRFGQALACSTFDLQELVTGEPVTIYMILPPDKLKSHKSLLKMWVGTMLKAVTSRQTIPELPTLMLLDECAQLENFPYLESIITLCAGYGVQCWTFWQDLSQLKSCYPSSWETILNNCAVIQTFGIRNRHMATQWGDYLEHGSESLMKLRPENQVLRVQGKEEVSCRRADYLVDERFIGLYDENPMYPHLRTKTQPLPEIRGHEPCPSRSLL